MAAARKRWKRGTIIVLGCGLSLLAAPALLYEEFAGSSPLQARYFSAIARKAVFGVGPGASASVRFPTAGPYDERLGYVNLPGYIARLRDQGCLVVEQAHWSPELSRLVERALFPPYREKAQAGLRVLDRTSDVLDGQRYPERIYARFEHIPPLLVRTLLFIENRELFDDRHPSRNPAIELDRLARASFDQLVRVLNSGHERPGASTLATQFEKFRHSPNGRTDSLGEKMRQMVSASVRAYMDGEDTRERRRAIVLDYVNSVPLAARPQWGEVHGLGDGLWVWFGRDFEEANRLLARHDTSADQAAVYREVLALLLAHRRPSYFLNGHHDKLEALTDRYLRLLAKESVIAPALRDAALRVRAAVSPNVTGAGKGSFAARKGVDAVRSDLAQILGVPRRYDLDRLDLTVDTSIDARAQQAVAQALRKLSDPREARRAGLLEERLLARGDPAGVVYSVMLFERVDGANLVRVQADNLDEPFDVNEGLKLDLGSTAKLRTLVTYLEAVAELHARLASREPDELAALVVAPEDALTRWARDYLLRATDRSLSAMLEGALERRYSASPSETFFTGGGVHRFSNFRREEDGRAPSVRDAFRHSTNLVFIRLMRDLVRYTMHRDGTAGVLQDPADERRTAYLERFADREGIVFLERYYRKYRGLSPAQVEALLLKTHPRALKLLHDWYASQRLSLADRAYVARIHPLELWLAEYLRETPEASFKQIVAASAGARREAYRWLFTGRNKRAQQRAIATMLEVDAFARIHSAWQRLGYPFESLVPSYASAIGSSADRPAALAELMGIIASGGVRLPAVRVTRLHFAAGTPYETTLACRPGDAERVLMPEIAALVRQLLSEVVDAGTALRARGLFTRQGGSTPILGGKTGTGDHRVKRFAPGGTLLESRPVNRAATFVFYLGERHFGTVTAYVSGPRSGDYRFTSSLPVQVLKVLEPALRELVAPVVLQAGAGQPVASR